MVKGREKVVLELCQYIESIVSSKKKKKDWYLLQTTADTIFNISTKECIW